MKDDKTATNGQKNSSHPSNNQSSKKVAADASSDTVKPDVSKPDEGERQDQAKPKTEPITDGVSQLSTQELNDLENAAEDHSSIESKSADMLDDEDNEGTPLNEGPDDEDLFDTGEDLDVPREALFPDLDPESDDN